MIKKTVNMNSFIATYDNYITKEECNNAIKFFENEHKFQRTMNRIAFENAEVLHKKDQQYFVNSFTIDAWFGELKSLLHNFDLAWKHYIENTGAQQAYGKDFYYTNLKIQKTLPTEGYHIWHVEHGASQKQAYRAFVFSIYLNDIEEGGETEFLNQSVRVKPKAGRIAIWPAGFPYVHRGNPPFSGEKYILTSWMTLVDVS